MALTRVNTNGIQDGQVFTADVAPFAVTAEKLASDALDHRIIVGVAGGNAAYTFLGEGCNSSTQNPSLYLTRGKTYQFSLSYGSALHPFRIQSTAGTSGTEYNTGVTNNGGGGGSTVIFEVPHDAPAQLYYQCTSHAAMNGSFFITGKIADSIVTSSNLADQAVTLAKLEHGTSLNNGKFLRANNGTDPTFETVSTDVVGDTSPQLGGNLDLNGNTINGTGNISVTGNISANALTTTNGNIIINSQTPAVNFVDSDANPDYQLLSNGGEFVIKDTTNSANRVVVNSDGHVDVLGNLDVGAGIDCTGTCTATAFAGDGSALTGIQGIPSGVIMMWSGAENAIPTGFVLCDGNNSTPNLTERFVIGAGGSGNSSVSGSSAYAVGATGGNVSVSSGSGTAPGTAYNWPAGSPNELGVNNRGHTHPVDVLPPYYALCYIMKT